MSKQRDEDQKYTAHQTEKRDKAPAAQAEIKGDDIKPSSDYQNSGAGPVAEDMRRSRDKAKQINDEK